MTNCLKGVDTERRYGQLKTNAKINMWKTHSEDDAMMLNVEKAVRLTGHGSVQ